MMATKKRSGIFTTGLAIFSMFFGAGNLIFPLLIGQSVGDNVWYAIGGLGITAVLVPLAGLTAMLLHDADTDSFFGSIGRLPGIALLFLLQLILGPFGVIPRLVTLMHATSSPYLGGLPLIPFSLLTASVIFFFSFQKRRLVGLLGAVLTPLLLLSLGALFFFGLTDGSSLTSQQVSKFESFQSGLLGGYNTMDLIAALLFATVILPHFKAGSTDKGTPLKNMFFSSLIAALLLLLTYIGLCLISANHPHLGAGQPPEQLLNAIATSLLGPRGGLIATVAILLACLTTAITLASIFADYLSNTLSGGGLGNKRSLAATLLITTLFANMGFSGLASFLGPLLQVIYPGLILLTLYNILKVSLKSTKPV